MKNLHSWQIVATYTIFSLLWIFFSDTILEALVKDAANLTKWQTYKGFMFIAITSLLLYSLISKYGQNLKSIQEKLKEIKQRLEYVILGANLGYWDWEYQTGKHYVNEKWLLILGLSKKDIKEDLSDWESRIHPEDKEEARQAVEKSILSKKPYVVEFRMRHKDGHWIWIEGSGGVVAYDATGKPLRLAGTQKDISQRKTRDEQIRFLALYDSLTELPNRYCLQQYIEKMITDKNQSFSFLFLDLDSFKTINDIYGHSFGDTLIQDVTKRLKENISSLDYLARVGGDEFVILLHDSTSVQADCERLIKAFEEPFFVKNDANKLSFSMGVTNYPKDGICFEELLKNADIAMYTSKNRGKNQFCLYTPLMSETLYLNAKFDAEIKDAISKDEFILHYQPQIDFKSGKIIGLEALVRWQKEDKLIYPNDFISKAEENRSIIQIGELVLQKAFVDLELFSKKYNFEGTIAINISTVQIAEDNFIANLKKLCNQTKIDTTRIELEITESYIMQSPTKSIKVLGQLRSLGFKLSIDDFGTGHSSLSYLKKLPVDKLKIDRSFVMGLPEDKEDSAISKTIITLAKNLDLEVLAEGVETKEQEAFFKENLCDYAQGYLYAKPLDKIALEEFFKTYL